MEIFKKQGAELFVLDYRNDQPRLTLLDEQVYALLKEKKEAGVLNTNFDFVDIETEEGEMLHNRIIEDAQYLILFHHETYKQSDIKNIFLSQLEVAGVY